MPSVSIFGGAPRSVYIILRETFTGDGSDKTFQLTSSVGNCTFDKGAWAVANIDTAYPSHVTGTDKAPTYDSLNLITRNRVGVSSIDANGLVTLDYAPRAGVSFYIWYWYELSSNDEVTYYREEFVASMEEQGATIAGSISVDVTNFANLLSSADTTVQAALDTLDDILTSAELTQLQNINTTTISTAQWAYVGAMNQGVATTNSPTFADLTISSPSSIYALSHDSFADFVADEHVAHSGVFISAGGILSGGGDISASRTISLAHGDVDHDQTANVHQDVNTTASPSFVAVSLGTGELTAGSINRAADVFTLEIAGMPVVSIAAASVTMAQTLVLSTCADAGADVDKFLVLDASNNVDYRTGAEVLSDIGGASTAHKDTHDPNDGSDPLDCAAAAEISVVVAAAEGTAHSFARSDHVHAINHAITDNHIVTIDGTANANEHAVFTASGIAGLTDTELLAALSGDAGAAFSWNSQNLTAVGTIGCGTITSTGNLVIADAGYIGSASGPDAFQIQADGDVVFSQKVGIGVSPARELQIQAGHVYVEFQSTTANEEANLKIYNDTNPLYVGVADDNEVGGGPFYGTGFLDNAGVISTGAAYELQFGVNNVARVTINTTGDMGIATSSPQARLEVEDGGTAHSVLLKITQDDANVWGWRVGNDSYSTTDALSVGCYLDNSGNAYLENTAAGDFIIASRGTANTSDIYLRAEDDIIFQDYNGGSPVTRITFDMPTGAATFTGNIHATGLKSGADQAAAGAAAGELWHDTDDHTIKIGV